MATHSGILAWRIPMDGGAWRATVHRVAQSWTWLKRLSAHTHLLCTHLPFAQMEKWKSLQNMISLFFCWMLWPKGGNAKVGCGHNLCPGRVRKGDWGGLGGHGLSRGPGASSAGGTEAKSGDLIYSGAKKGSPFKALQSLLHFNKEGRGDKSLSRH